MIPPTVLPSGKILSARAIASAERRLDERATAKETHDLTELLARLPPGLADEYRTLLKSSAEKGKATPRDWSNASAFFYARCLVDAEMACKKAGIPIRFIGDFSSAPAVTAVEDAYQTASGSGQNAARILRGLRTLIRVVGGSTSKSTGRTIRALSRTPRRGAGQILPSTTECRSAALAAFLGAATMIANGAPRRGKTRMCDAVLFALEVETNLRRGEFHAITVEIMVFSAVKAEVWILIPEAASKVRQVQLGILQDKGAITMLQVLIGDKKEGALFETNWATPLASASKYKALQRIGLRTVGIALNFNKARRIGVTSETSIGAMQRRVRHVKRSEVAEQTYASHVDDIGIEECRATLSQYGSCPVAFKGTPEQL